MSPKRVSKAGTRRMDAAIDSLSQMGFPVPLIRETIRNLLKAYGGDVGWQFIEENSYTLLIDTILEKQKKPEGGDEGTKFLENVEPKLLTGNEVSKKDNITEKKPEENSDRSKQVQSPGIESPPRKKLATRIYSPGNTSASVAESALGNLKGETFQVKSESTLPSLHISAVRSTQLFSPPPHPPRERKPCYGWLSSDDDEEEADLVQD